MPTPRAGEPHPRRLGLALFVLCVTLGGAATLGLVPTGAAPSVFAERLTITIFWCALAVAGEFFWLENLAQRGMLSMSSLVYLACLFQLEPVSVARVAFFAVLISDLALHRRPWVRAAFNAGQTACALFLARTAMDLLRGALSHGQTAGGIAHVSLDLLPWLVAIAIYWTVNTLLVSTVIGLDGQSSIVKVWRANYANAAYLKTYCALAAAGAILAAAVQWAGLILAPLALVVCPVAQAAHRAFREQKATPPTPLDPA